MTTSNQTRRRFVPVLILMSVLLPSSLGFAVPVTYKMQVFTSSGKLGNVTFSGPTTVTFTFQGDTANVFPFTTGPSIVVTGYKNLLGTASVSIQDNNTKAILAAGNFQSSAGIFVSVDNTNSSMGFGSAGGDPVYPGGMTFDSYLSTYDLRSSVDTYAQSGAQLFGFLSCIGFPMTWTCSDPVALATDAGDFYINPSPCCVNCCAEFIVQVTQQVPFSAMAASYTTGRNSFSVAGRFTLGSGSNGIDPLTDTVTVALNSSTLTFPPGSFKRTERGNYLYSGTMNGVKLLMEIQPLNSPGEYAFRIQGYGATTIGSPLNVTLTIGDDSGTATAVARHDD